MMLQRNICNSNIWDCMGVLSGACIDEVIGLSSASVSLNDRGGM